VLRRDRHERSKLKGSRRVKQGWTQQYRGEWDEWRGPKTAQRDKGDPNAASRERAPGGQGVGAEGAQKDAGGGGCERGPETEGGAIQWDGLCAA